MTEDSRFWQVIATLIAEFKTVAFLGLMGAAIGLGKVLVSKERLSVRLILGRSIISAGLAIAAGSVLAFIPDLDDRAIYGLASGFAVMGEQFFERFVNSKLGNGPSA